MVGHTTLHQQQFSPTFGPSKLSNLFMWSMTRDNSENVLVLEVRIATESKALKDNLFKQRSEPTHGANLLS